MSVRNAFLRSGFAKKANKQAVSSPLRTKIGVAIGRNLLGGGTQINTRRTGGKITGASRQKRDSRGRFA